MGTTVLRFGMLGVDVDMDSDVDVDGCRIGMSMEVVGDRTGRATTVTGLSSPNGPTLLPADPALALYSVHPRTPNSPISFALGDVSCQWTSSDVVYFDYRGRSAYAYEHPPYEALVGFTPPSATTGVLWSSTFRHPGERTPCLMGLCPCTLASSTPAIAPAAAAMATLPSSVRIALAQPNRPPTPPSAGALAHVAVAPVISLLISAALFLLSAHAAGPLGPASNARRPIPASTHP